LLIFFQLSLLVVSIFRSRLDRRAAGGPVSLIPLRLASEIEDWEGDPLFLPPSPPSPPSLSSRPRFRRSPFREELRLRGRRRSGTSLFLEADRERETELGAPLVTNDSSEKGGVRLATTQGNRPLPNIDSLIFVKRAKWSIRNEDPKGQSRFARAAYLGRDASMKLLAQITITFHGHTETTRTRSVRDVTVTATRSHFRAPEYCTAKIHNLI
jgi:hypothetical protein